MAQSTRKQLKTANKFWEQENYRAAIPFYEQVLAKEPNNALALFRAGIDPWRPAREVSASDLAFLWADNAALMREGVRLGRIVTTRPEHRPGIPAESAWPEHANYVYQRQGLACLAQGAGPLQGFDVGHPPQAQSRPVLIDGHLAHRLKALLPKDGPALVAVEFAAVAPGRALWIRHPHHRVPL
ncbi:hypothetical protein ACFO6P_28220, partial [Cupriavidus campinensis]